jgi:hypothetical protein
VILMSDAGGGANVTNIDLTISDAGVPMPDITVLSSGTYRPLNYGVGDLFNAPAPVGPYFDSMAAFIGDSPNGTWSLYVMDDGTGNGGSFAGGWSLDVTVGPSLDITRLTGSRVALSWPDEAVGFNVETTPELLSNAVWFPLAVTPIASGGQYRVTNTIGPTNLFYRLVK